MPDPKLQRAERDTVLLERIGALRGEDSPVLIRMLKVLLVAIGTPIYACSTIVFPVELIDHRILPEWLGITLAVVLVITILVIPGVITYLLRSRDRVRADERVIFNRIHTSFNDGRTQTLSLFAPDLTLEASSGLEGVPVSQHALTAADGPDGEVRVLIARSPLLARFPFGKHFGARQPDKVLAKLAIVAQKSPHPAGREVALQLHELIATRMTVRGWRH